MSDNQLEYFFRDPAAQWSDALPVGNGRMGAMIYGDPRVERIFLSDATFWSGEPSGANNNPDGPRIVAEVRRLLLAGDIPAANKLCEQIEGRKLNYGTNLPFGNLRIWMAHNDADGGATTKAPTGAAWTWPQPSPPSGTTSRRMRLKGQRRATCARSLPAMPISCWSYTSPAACGAP